MERSDEGARTPARGVAGWRYAVLVAACVAGGLTLTIMVIGPDPAVTVDASSGTVPATSDTMPSPDVTAGSSIAPDLPVDTTVGETSSVQIASTAGDRLATPVIAATPVTPAAMPVQAPSVGGQPNPAPAMPATTAVAPPATVPAPIAVPATTVSPATTVGPAATVAAVPSSTTAVTTAPPPAIALTYPTFQVSGAGAVTLAFDGSTISVASVSPQANWVFDIDSNGPRSVEVKFFNVATQQESEFHAALEGGRIKVEN